MMSERKKVLKYPGRPLPFFQVQTMLMRNLHKALSTRLRDYSARDRMNKMMKFETIKIVAGIKIFFGHWTVHKFVCLILNCPPVRKSRHKRRYTHTQFWCLSQPRSVCVRWKQCKWTRTRRRSVIYWLVHSFIIMYQMTYKLPYATAIEHHHHLFFNSQRTRYDLFP